MTAIRLLGQRGRAFARRFSRRDEFDVVDDPLLSVADAEPLPEEPVVTDVVVVEPVEKVYKATVTRTVTQTAVVEFTAMEGTDTMTMAQELLETIPPESWVTQPTDSWGYIDQIEEVAEAAAVDDVLDDIDPLDTPEVLSRRRRAMRARRFAGKAAFDVSVDGAYFATYEAETPEDAILAYVHEAGFASVDEAADGLGMAVEDFLASVTATEALVQLEDEAPAEDEDDEEEVPPETMARRRRLGFARRGRRSRRLGRKMSGADAIAEIDIIASEAQAATTAEEASALLERLKQIFIDAGDPDELAAVEAWDSVSGQLLSLMETLPSASGGY